MNLAPAADHQHFDDTARAALRKGEWKLALEAVEQAQASLCRALADGQEAQDVTLEAHRRLVNALLGALHKRITAGEDGELESEERAELCWRLQGLLERHGQLPLDRPAWLPVAEEQLVRHGALLWREAISTRQQAAARALVMFRRLASLLDPCPAWVSATVLQLEGNTAEQPPQRPAARKSVTRIELVLQPGRKELIANEGQLLFNLAPFLDDGNGEDLVERLVAFMRQQVTAVSGFSERIMIRHPLNSLGTDLAVLDLLGEPLPRKKLPVLQLAAATWMVEADRCGSGVVREAWERPAQGLAGEEMVLELDTFELAVLQLVLLASEKELAEGLQELERRENDPGFWNAGERVQDWWRHELELVDVLRRFARDLGFYASRQNPVASLRAWSDDALSLLAEAALLEQVSLWSSLEAAEWLLLPLQMELGHGSVRPALVRGRPELAELQELLAGEEVIYIGPLAEAVESQWRSGRCWRLWQGRQIEAHGLRCLAPPESRYPRRPHTGFEASLAHSLQAVERLLEERPASLVLIGAGAYRLPLCRALRDLHGVRCLAFGTDLGQLYGVLRPGEQAIWRTGKQRDLSQWLALADEG